MRRLIGVDADQFNIIFKQAGKIYVAKQSRRVDFRKLFISLTQLNAVQLLLMTSGANIKEIDFTDAIIYPVTWEWLMERLIIIATKNNAFQPEKIVLTNLELLEAKRSKAVGQFISILQYCKSIQEIVVTKHFPELVDACAKYDIKLIQVEPAKKPERAINVNLLEEAFARKYIALTHDKHIPAIMERLITMLKSIVMTDEIAQQITLTLQIIANKRLSLFEDLTGFNKSIPYPLDELNRLAVSSLLPQDIPSTQAYKCYSQFWSEPTDTRKGGYASSGLRALVVTFLESYMSYLTSAAFMQDTLSGKQTEYDMNFCFSNVIGMIANFFMCLSSLISAEPKTVSTPFINDFCRIPLVHMLQLLDLCHEFTVDTEKMPIIRYLPSIMEKPEEPGALTLATYDQQIRYYRAQILGQLNDIEHKQKRIQKALAEKTSPKPAPLSCRTPPQSKAKQPERAERKPESARTLRF